MNLIVYDSTLCSDFSVAKISVQKSVSVPGWRKNCEKISPYFQLSEVENCPKLHFFGKNCQNLHFFGFKLQNFANLGVKIEKIGQKVSKFALFGKKFPPTLILSTPPLFLFDRIFTYV